MGLSRVLQHNDAERSTVADFGMHSIFHLLHSLGATIYRPGLGLEDISDRRLELGCHDGAYYTLVLGQSALD